MSASYRQVLSRQTVAVCLSNQYRQIDDVCIFISCCDPQPQQLRPLSADAHLIWCPRPMPVPE